MEFIKKVAQEVSILVPKLIVGIHKSFFEVEELTNRQIIVLLFIYENNSVKITDIADNFLVSSPTVTGITERLVKKGYLIRVRGRDDRRIVYVRLNQKGEKFVSKFRDTVKKRWESILSFLDREEQEAYLRILKKIIKALGKKNEE